MGRTLHTYRMRLQSIRDQMNRILKPHLDKDTFANYHRIWEGVHHYAAPASAYPWPDTQAIITYCMILELMGQVEILEKKLDESLQKL